MSFLTETELKELNFKYLGKNIKISRKASIYNPQYISIGNNSRIDDFCILSPSEKGIIIGEYVHIACYSSLIGKEKIELQDFSGLSSKVSIYSSSDNYLGSCLTNPTVPDEFKDVISLPVVIEKHVIVGAGAIILPNVIIGIGAAIGALSLVNRNCEPFGIYAGVPAKKVKERKKDLLQIEQEFRNSLL